MAIRGMITGKEVLAHAGLIAREFGISTLWRCCVAIALRRWTTFLDCTLSGDLGTWTAGPGTTAT